MRLNNHRETLIFRVTLLYDENIESLIWLFKTFLEAMFGKKPITVFINEDATMEAIIPKVMSEAYHILCSWHIWQNALKHMYI